LLRLLLRDKRFCSRGALINQSVLALQVDDLCHSMHAFKLLL